MDPSTMMMLMSIVGPMLSGGMGGQEGEFKSTYNPNQLGLIDNLISQIKGGNKDITQNQNYQQGQNWLSGLFSDPDFFKNFEAPLQRQFQEQTVPDLANRFASMGSGGAMGSTGFRNQLAREGSNLSTNIAALRGGMQQQGVNQALQYGQQPIQNMMQMLQSALQPTQNVYQGPTAGPLGNIMSSLAGGAAQGFGQNWGQNMAGLNQSRGLGGNSNLIAQAAGIHG